MNGKLIDKIECVALDTGSAHRLSRKRTARVNTYATWYYLKPPAGFSRWLFTFQKEGEGKPLAKQVRP